MAFLAPWGLSRWAMAVPGLFSKIFTYTRRTNTHTEREGERFISSYIIQAEDVRHGHSVSKYNIALKNAQVSLRQGQTETAVSLL